ncbi:alpha/beta fold hydrolase [Spirulina sp. CCNP1310]|uniref:alpha/beta fold hydrolase n=1 Tax=Spirulina sp. CCNP1310 TaxID=3110249 RepID=UPI002B201053|nr:alpha/beta fold hydrolase [Spirulina sp. CCNP1310]MEA5420301.1 alpha/beta fold hydrolase [Spirulina sp. CCNP1310]
MSTVALSPLSTVPGQIWQWRDYQIYYIKAGDNAQRPPLLLVHGFGASTDHWRKNIAELQSDFEVWAIDLLGFGRSQKPDIAYSGDLWRDQLTDFIAEVIGRPVVLAGNSLGGYSALCVAAQRPQWAKGLILLNCAGPFTAPPGTPEPPLWRKWLGEITKGFLLQPWASFWLFQYLRRPAIIRKTLEKVYLDRSAVTDQLVADIHRASCDRGALQVFSSVFKAPQGEKNDRLLAQMQCPLLMLWGEGDPWMLVGDRAPKFRVAYPHPDQYEEHFLQAGHCPHDEIPAIVNGHIREWVQGLSRIAKG